MADVKNKFRVGSIYYNEEKQFFWLITHKTDDALFGYTSRWGNPSFRERYSMLHTEKVGAFDFGGIKIAFGNLFDMKIDKPDTNFRYVRTLQKCEMQTFRMILDMILNNRLVRKEANGMTRPIR